MKLLLILIGSISLALGIIGIFLPLLPTTPFLLLASACYMRSSPRMHQWLRNAPLAGRYLREYEETRTIPLRAKIMAMLLLWPSMLWAAWRVESLPLQVLLMLIASAVSIYLWTRKSRPAAAGRFEA